MKVELIGTFYNNHSLSIINRNLAKLLKDKVDLYITCLDSYDPENNVNKDDIRVVKQIESKELPLDINVQLRHTYPPVWRWPTNPLTKIVFIQPWEFSKTPMEWQYKWETFADALVVPSSWEAGIVMNAGLDPSKLFTIPNGYDTEVFNTEPEENKFLEDDKFTFVFVGNSQYRKGVDILLNAWSDAFSKADKVQLFIKDTPKIYGENNLLNEIVRMQYKTSCASVIYNDDDLSQKDMANIFKNSNIVVHPFRGEGFGMHIQEAMACGCLPLITYGGAPNDFVKEENGFFFETNQIFIDINDKKIFASKPGDSFSNMGGHSWALEPTVDDVKRKMQYLYYHHDRENIINDKIKNHNLYTWNYVADGFAKVLQKIHEQDGVPYREKLKIPVQLDYND